MLNLALLDQLLHGSRHVFNGNLGVYAVLIEQIDGIDFEPLERAFDDLLNVLWPAIQATPSRFAVESRFVTKLGRYYYLPAEGQERFAHEFFICVRAINFGGIEECDTSVHGRVEKRDHLFPVRKRMVRPAHSHAAEPQS